MSIFNNIINSITQSNNNISNIAGELSQELQKRDMDRGTMAQDIEMVNTIPPMTTYQEIQTQYDYANSRQIHRLTSKTAPGECIAVIGGDVNNLTKCGLYRVSDSANTPNGWQHCIVEVQAMSHGYALQRATDLFKSGQIYQRRYAGGWGGWVRFGGCEKVSGTTYTMTNQIYNTPSGYKYSLTYAQIQCTRVPKLIVAGVCDSANGIDFISYVQFTMRDTQKACPTAMSYNFKTSDGNLRNISFENYYIEGIDQGNFCYRVPFASIGTNYTVRYYVIY